MYNRASLNSIIDKLASPQTLDTLEIDNSGEKLNSSNLSFPIINNKPVLYRSDLMQFFDGKGINIPLNDKTVLEYQYFLLSSIKQNLPQRNSPLHDPWYEFHLKCSAELLKDASGTILDIGCDSDKSASMIFPDTVEYVGLDVCVSNDKHFQVVGLAEFLPFKNDSFDNVALITSLDHVLDYKTAVDEAYRVLKKGGNLYFSSLVWYKNYDLFRDINHFHHFTEGQLIDCLKDFRIQQIKKYDWKEGGHRQSMYLKAIKI